MILILAQLWAMSANKNKYKTPRRRQTVAFDMQFPFLRLIVIPLWSSRFRVIWLYHSEIVEFCNEWMLVVTLKNGHGFHAPYYSTIPCLSFPPSHLPPSFDRCRFWLLKVLACVLQLLTHAAPDYFSSWLFNYSSCLLQLQTLATHDSCNSWLLQLLTLAAPDSCSSWFL